MEEKIRFRMFSYMVVFFLHFHLAYYTLLVLSALFGPLLGALNALVYGFNGTLRQRYTTCYTKTSTQALNHLFLT